MELQHVYLAARNLWHQYLEVGPGVLEPEALKDFSKAKHRYLADGQADSQIQNMLAELEELLTRCVERSEGLSFVTGEAGLIPNRQLHDKCERLIESLGNWQDPPT